MINVAQLRLEVSTARALRGGEQYLFYSYVIVEPLTV